MIKVTGIHTSEKWSLKLKRECCQELEKGFNFINKIHPECISIKHTKLKRSVWKVLPEDLMTQQSMVLNIPRLINRKMNYADRSKSLNTQRFLPPPMGNIHSDQYVVSVKWKSIKNEAKSEYESASIRSAWAVIENKFSKIFNFLKK